MNALGSGINSGSSSEDENRLECMGHEHVLNYVFEKSAFLDLQPSFVPSGDALLHHPSPYPDHFTFTEWHF
ncbi:hypothetical protein EYC80_003324 [Monilinia laxa]|uniref:Uncharacterized protein n=1 Tax=Monilinia laxa TaxID=61186 RepID=A0A5N6KDD8_MONLA|nr:hypothetical protein EYC80_003324 [Monilinia laxa]